MRRLRSVVIGAGARVFRKHRPGLERPGFEVVGVSDINDVTRRALALQLGCAFHRDFTGMVDCLRPDVAVILTPHALHAEMAIHCLNQGCHVLVEKPMAVNTAEADAMIEAADRNGRCLAACLQHRLRPEVVAARELVDAGRIGDIRRAQVIGSWPRFSRYYERSPWRGTWLAMGGGALLNQGIHQLDILALLLGVPSAVTAWTGRQIHSIAAEDTAFAILEWDRGCVGTVDITTASAEAARSIEITGSRGRILIEDGSLTLSDFDADMVEFMRNGANVQWQGGRPERIAFAPASNDHRLLYENFHAAICYGESLVASGRSARASIEIANAIAVAGYLKAEVRVPVSTDQYQSVVGVAQNPLQRGPRAVAGGV